MTCEYFRISGPKTYLWRLAEASGRVQTEYVFLVDHEECILWSGVKATIVFLRDNEDHSCAGGISDTAQRSRRKISLLPHYNWKNKFCLLEESALERFRIAFQSKPTRDLTYQLKRSIDLRVFAETVEEVNLVGRSRNVPEYLQFGFLYLSENTVVKHFHTELEMVALLRQCSAIQICQLVQTTKKCQS